MVYLKDIINGFSRDAHLRGFYLGRKTVSLFRSCMEQGYSLEMYLNQRELDAQEAQRFGIIGPIGEGVGWLYSPNDLVMGSFYFIRNKIQN